MLNYLRTFVFASAIAILAVIAGSSALAQPSSKSISDLPPWVKQVGAQQAPKSLRVFTAEAVGDGTTNSTREIQRAIDDCGKAGGGIVTFKPGNYVTGALFLKSNV